MKLSEAEDHLFERLSAARESSVLHRDALGHVFPESLSEVAAVGLDTNVLKALRRNLPLAERVDLNLVESAIQLILPGQAVTEFWNNHQIFANEEWNKFGADFRRLAKKIEDEGFNRYNPEHVATIGKLVSGIQTDLQEEKSPEYLNRSQSLLQTLLVNATKPSVSRTRFAGLAAIRLASKFPPGFADGATKVFPHGDFFVWVDFLLGALCADSHAGKDVFVWVTDDSKPDWKTGGGGHPSLVEEFLLVCDARLAVLSSNELETLVSLHEAALQPLAEDEGEPDGSLQ